MVNIKLKDFQIETIGKLLKATSFGIKQEILVKAPTGSGKTILLLAYIEEYLAQFSNTVFVWLTPRTRRIRRTKSKKATEIFS